MTYIRLKQEILFLEAIKIKICKNTKFKITYFTYCLIIELKKTLEKLRFVFTNLIDLNALFRGSVVEVIIRTYKLNVNFGIPYLFVKKKIILCNILNILIFYMIGIQI